MMRRIARGSLAFVLVGIVAMPALASAQEDSTVHRPLFTAGDAVLASAILLSARLVHPLDKQYMRRLQDSSTQANRRLQQLSKGVRTLVAPGAYIIGVSLYTGGRLSGNDKLAELGLHSTEALLVGEATATAIKWMTGRARPYVNGNPDDYQFGRGFSSGDYKSFPSGHTVAAFAAAAAVTSEVSSWAPDQRWLVGAVMYSGAATVGMSRMYNNQHWASDVIVGAGLGTFAGLKVVRFHHGNPGNRLDRWLLSASVIPSANGSRSVRWSLLPMGLPGDVPRSAAR